LSQKIYSFKLLLGNIVIGYTFATMCQDTRNALQKAIDGLGPYKIAKLVQRRGPSIYKWRESGRLPRTEWTGETNYAAAIVEACKGTEFECTREQLLQLPAAPDPVSQQPAQVTP
jgi:hypothetical protein